MLRLALVSAYHFSIPSWGLLQEMWEKKLMIFNLKIQGMKEGICEHCKHEVIAENREEKEVYISKNKRKNLWGKIIRKIVYSPVTLE